MSVTWLFWIGVFVAWMLCASITDKLSRIISLLEKANEIQWDRDADKREKDRWHP